MTEWTNKRIGIARKYKSHISSDIIAPKENNNITHVYHKYAIRCTNINRDEIVNSNANRENINLNFVTKIDY